MTVVFWNIAENHWFFREIGNKNDLIYKIKIEMKQKMAKSTKTKTKVVVVKDDNKFTALQQVLEQTAFFELLNR
jgi:hypothetical protein